MAAVLRPGEPRSITAATGRAGRDGGELGDIEVRLCDRFPHIDPGVVADAVRDAYRSFDGARVRTFVPLLVENRAGRTLRARRATL